VTTQSLGAAVLSSFYSTWNTSAASGVLRTNYGGDVRVFDGPPLDDRTAPIELWVGSTGEEEDEETVIRGVQQQDTFEAVGSRSESIDITNTIWVADGSTSVGASRTRAFAVFNDVVTLVRDSGLSVANLFHVTQALSWELRQGQYKTGAGVKLTFVTRVDGLV
jgi:hypothetical protein